MLILEDSRTQKVHTLAFSPDGRTLASVNGRSTAIKLWDLDTRQVREQLHGDRNRITNLAFSPDGKWLASVNSVSRFWLWSLLPPLRQLLHVEWPRTDALAHAPGQVVFAPDSLHAATNLPHNNGWNQTIEILALDGSRRAWRTNHEAEVSCLAYCLDGRFLATGSFDRNVHLYNLTQDGEMVRLNHGQKVHYLIFSPDGTTLAAGSPQGLVKVWDATTGKKRSTLKGQARPLRALCYSPDGRTIVTAGGEGAVAFWDVADSRSRLVLDWGVGEVYSVVFATDGMRAAAGGVGKIVVWDIDWDL